MATAGQTILINMGINLINLAKYNEAIKYFDKAISIDSNNKDANKGATIYKALALDKLGLHEEAIFFYDKVLMIDSSGYYSNNR